MKSSAVLVLIHCYLAGMNSLCEMCVEWCRCVCACCSWKMLRWLRLLLLKHEKAWNWSCRTFRHSWMLCQSPNRRCSTSRCVASFLWRLCLSWSHQWLLLILLMHDLNSVIYHWSSTRLSKSNDKCDSKNTLVTTSSITFTFSFPSWWWLLTVNAEVVQLMVQCASPM